MSNYTRFAGNKYSMTGFHFRFRFLSCSHLDGWMFWRTNLPVKDLQRFWCDTQAGAWCFRDAFDTMVRDIQRCKASQSGVKVLALSHLASKIVSLSPSGRSWVSASRTLTSFCSQLSSPSIPGCTLFAYQGVIASDDVTRLTVPVPVTGNHTESNGLGWNFWYPQKAFIASVFDTGVCSSV